LIKYNKIEEGESQKQLPSTTTVTSGFKEKDKKIAANNNDEMVEEEVLEIIEEEEVSEYAEEVVFEEENLSESNYKSTNAESLTEMDLAVTKNHNEFKKDNASSANQKRSVKQKASRSKDKIATAPSAIANYEVVADEYNSALPSKYLYGLKVVDYTEVYTLEYIQQKELEDQSLSPRYGNSLEKKAEESSLNNMYQEITYKDLLDDAIKNYKEKKYTVAKEQFFQILQKHPDDVNAQFYLGLCYYELGEYVNAMQYFELTVKNKQQAFNQEAAWYGALCLKNTGQIKAAKKAFKQIVDLKGFYAQKAQKELMLIESQENKMNKNGQFMEDGK
jgi:TolA-binding protein